MKNEHITAYALGELQGPQREDFERALAASPELQSTLASTAALCDAIPGAAEEDLGSRRRASLLADCRRNIAAGERRRKVAKIVFASSLTALAACLLIAPMLPWTTLHRGAPPDAGSGGRSSGFLVQAPPAPRHPLAENLPGSSASVAWADEAGAVPPAMSRVSPDDRSDVDAKRIIDQVAAQPSSSLVTMAGSLAPAPQLGPPASREEAVALATSAPLLADKDAARPVRQFSSGWSSPDARPADSLARSSRGGFNTEAYDAVEENRFLEAQENPLSTFSIDVDTASYANVRRFLNDGQLPPKGAIRVEEMLNYFPYDYPQPDAGRPFSANVESARAPWNPEHELVRIGIQGRRLDPASRPPASLVFLIDVSGSMRPENKLPLLKRSLAALAENLGADDRIAIAGYAGAAGLVLPPTSGSDKQTILSALARLDAGGSTNGAEGIRLAYQAARDQFLKNGTNRVILCTDGDFNVGTTSQSSLVELIESERSSGIFLSVLGFGRGNLKDSTMEKLADKGNGNYAYIDSLAEGRKVLVDEVGGTLFTIAKDVKIQVEFNPARVAAYRLIGYENRLLAKEDFNDDRKDAGEIGAGHSVTALYEIVPAGSSLPGRPPVDPLKYQPAPAAAASPSQDLLTLKLRYKEPAGSTSKLIEFPVRDAGATPFAEASTDFQFAATVAAFGMKLRGSPGADPIPWKDLLSTARRNLGEDPGSHRAEFLTLIEKAARLPQPSPAED